jgi:hypothetical protein
VPKIKIPLLLVVLAAVFSVSTAPAMGLKAFIARGFKSGAKNTNKVRALGTMSIKLGGLEIRCESSTGAGVVTSEKSSVTEQSLKPEKCKCLLGAVKIKEIPYKFSFSGSERAARGSAELLSLVELEGAGLKCKILSHQLFKESETYENKGNNLIQETNIEKVKYEGLEKGENGSIKVTTETTPNETITGFNVE